jgi:hypothetical protein
MSAARFRAARALARRLGYHLVKADYYSPIPDVEALPESLWTEPAPMPGVDLRLDASLELLERDLAPFIAEYAPPDDPPGTAHGYHRSNSMYPAVDGEILYALVRHLQPGRIVEVGAGWSTRVIRDALERNETPCAHRIFDPSAAEVAERIGDSADLVALGAEQIGDEVFAELEAGDILFIDTTHTVKAGNDVLRLELEVLPTLAPGVVVHIHDFFRPFEYPRFLMEDFGVYWQEQYLLQAFLAFNERFEVLIANHALGRLRREGVAAVIGGLPDPSPGSALWLRVRAA